MILLTYGTRPEYIKIKPLIYEFKKNNIKFKTLFTGQHKNIVSQESSYKLEFIDTEGNRLDSIIKNCMDIPDNVFEGISYIMVQGDTTSVLGISIAAMHRKIPIIHLESGLRTYDYNNPYPEEYNRRLVSIIANIHLCPTELNKRNLKNENVLGDIYVVGNTSLDNLLDYKDRCEYQNIVLVTLHRRENHEKINEWFYNINELSKKYKNLKFIFPLHPNPNVQKYKNLLPNVEVIEPLSHEDLIEILIKSKIVITDSGGIQEECSFFNKKCLVCREKTERTESIDSTSFMVESPEKLKFVFDKEIQNFSVNQISPYGDGKSSLRILEILRNYDKFI